MRSDHDYARAATASAALALLREAVLKGWIDGSISLSFPNSIGRAEG